MPSAKERKAEAKRRAEEATLSIATKRRRTQKVKVYHVKPQRKDGKQTTTGAKVYMQEPQGLSPEAAFMEMRPKDWSVLEWMRLFTPDTELWEGIVEEALYAVESGEVGKGGVNV